MVEHNSTRAPAPHVIRAHRYSRAFGGKDLKPWGLSAEPSIKQVALEPEHVGLVLASDGVCDVASADDIAAVVAQAWERGEDAARALVYWAYRVGVWLDGLAGGVVRRDTVQSWRAGMRSVTVCSCMM